MRTTIHRTLGVLAIAAILLVSGVGTASATKHSTPSATLTVLPSSSLVYGGHADIAITVTNYGTDTANLFTYCTQNGVTWLENTTGVIGVGLATKGVQSPVMVDLPSAGSYQYDWVGGAASCHSDLWIYTWQGKDEIAAGVLTTVPFDVAA